MSKSHSLQCRRSRRKENGYASARVRRTFTTRPRERRLGLITGTYCLDVEYFQDSVFTGRVSSHRQCQSIRPEKINIANVGEVDTEEADIEVEEDTGHRAPKKVQRPDLPAQNENDEHYITHLPYRSWCTHCVRGRGEAHPHRRTAAEGTAHPEWHMDYCFMGNDGEQAQPILFYTRQR